VSNPIITPHGEKLCSLMLNEEYRNKLNNDILELKSWTLTNRQLCDIEMILNGGFSPLDGFMNQNNYDGVCKKMRLENNLLWPIPITLDINNELADKLEINEKIVLRDKEGFAIALLTVNDMWNPNKEEEAQQIYETTDIYHPGVNILLNETHPTYVGGSIKGIHNPKHYDYPQLRHTPVELRKIFHEKGWGDIIAFQTRNPMHRAHVELTKKALEEKNAKLLIHPVVGLTKPGDVNHYTRVRCYNNIMKKYPKDMAELSLLPLAMRMAGPKEALWHAIIRKNYGCNYFIIGRDHASPGFNKDNKPFYGPYDAQEMLNEHSNELGINMIPFKQLVYVKEKKSFMGIDEVPKDSTTLSVSGTELRNLLDQGKEIPEWFSYPEVVRELQKQRPSLSKRGFTIFFTGLSGSGKSTLANGLLVKLLEDGHRPVSLLDGDIVRTHLSSELGFSKEHRSLNVRRIGFVASEITKNGGIAICAPIAPYRLDRQFNRDMIDPLGGYIEIFVNTPLEICEQRDVKGLYAKARKGLLKQFTGIDDPYEKPENAEIVIDSSDENPEILVDQILDQIHKMGY
jgi:sulfate adenylyltransferase|tara:strand:+ start:2058 stop:3767 length:1710 start_codon:yes stop_codon:yes gene_type:complete